MISLQRARAIMTIGYKQHRRLLADYNVFDFHLKVRRCSNAEHFSAIFRRLIATYACPIYVSFQQRCKKIFLLFDFSETWISPDTHMY